MKLILSIGLKIITKGNTYLNKLVYLTLLLSLIVPFTMADTIIINHIEYNGALNDVGNISRVLDRGDIILSEGSDYTNRIATFSIILYLW